MREVKKKFGAGRQSSNIYTTRWRTAYVPEICLKSVVLGGDGDTQYEESTTFFRMS